MSITPATGRPRDALELYRFERDSVEMVVVELTVDGQPATSIETTLTPYAADDDGSVQPDDWSPATTAGTGDDAVVGHLVSGLEPGLHTVWVRYPANPETPVRRVAHVRVR